MTRPRLTHWWRDREAPPDGYRYTCFHCGTLIEKNHYTGWIAKAKEHLKANDVPIPDDLEEVMQEQLCDVLPPKCCEFSTGKYVNTRLSWEDIKNGTVAILRSVVSGFVDQAEADRRAAICVKCPYNIRVGGCSSCKVSKFVTGDILKKKTKYDSQIRSCAICRCHLQAKVWVPKNIVDSVTSNVTREAYPDFCWAK